MHSRLFTFAALLMPLALAAGWSTPATAADNVRTIKVESMPISGTKAAMKRTQIQRIEHAPQSVMTARENPFGEGIIYQCDIVGHDHAHTHPRIGLPTQPE